MPLTNKARLLPATATAHRYCQLVYKASDVLELIAEQTPATRARMASTVKRYCKAVALPHTPHLLTALRSAQCTAWCRQTAARQRAQQRKDAAAARTDAWGEPLELEEASSFWPLPNELWLPILQQLTGKCCRAAPGCCCCCWHCAVTNRADMAHPA